MKPKLLSLEDVRSNVSRKWRSGALILGTLEYPIRIPVHLPPTDWVLSNQSAVQSWINDLVAQQRHGYRLETRTAVIPGLGKQNNIPAAILIDDEAQALRLIDKSAEMAAFKHVLAITRSSLPAAESWIAIHPHKAITNSDAWEQVLKVVAWIEDNPNPGIYLRQASIPGVHSKFIEANKSLIHELITHIRGAEKTSSSGFEARYGFRTDSPAIRFRFLDPKLFAFGLSDITARSGELGRFTADIEQVFITENLANFLAFPQVAGGMIFFGAGYGFANWQEMQWLQGKRIHYWGDIDTHGFSILNQFRKVFPETRSFLMDWETFLANKAMWTTEKGQNVAALPFLTEEERALRDALLPGGEFAHMRLEQEFIPFDRILETLNKEEPK